MAEALQVVDPEPDTLAVLACQLARQAPGDADVAVVVDDGAEDVPAHRWMFKPVKRQY